MDAPQGPGPSLPGGIQDPDSVQSGWDRVRELYQRNERGEYSQEADFIVKSAVIGAVVGFVYGGVPAARHSREHYIKQSQAEIYRHRAEALISARHAANRGFVRYGFRWGWRIAAFVTIFNSVNCGLSAYRDKVAITHFAVAGAVTGGLFRLNLGLRGLIGGSVIGALCGVPFGAVISGLQTLTGEDLYEQKRRHRRELYESNLQQWAAQLQLTDTVVKDLSQADRESAMTEAERINHLLNLPSNPGPAPQQSEEP
ncbi:complex I assembly factor TIMMDC1, mitochondrial [Pseudophryne corroboree]|uniref:complex I assembly factor TIMMDC1, mitochondrial n=1 Tax=Pseudophryne corroboree TaxID=495146 RepID=UPI0030817888